MPAEPGEERAVELRRQAFLRAGFSPVAARDLAGRLDLDLQQSLALVKHGFPPELAYEMILSGSRPVF
jgi:hypothetical protein